jgi:phosphatidylglycerophosphatase A
VTPPRLIASVLGIGFLRPAPGTWGSAVVLPCALLGPLPCLILGLLVLLAGFLAVRRLPDAEADPGWIVVDEAAGQLLALAALPAQPSLIGVAAAFLLFRAFDILKPGPVGWADRQHGALGVMLDDAVAGALAAALLAGFSVWQPGVLGQ